MWRRNKHYWLVNCKFRVVSFTENSQIPEVYYRAASLHQTSRIRISPTCTKTATKIAQNDRGQPQHSRVRSQRRRRAWLGRCCWELRARARGRTSIKIQEGSHRGSPQPLPVQPRHGGLADGVYDGSSLLPGNIVISAWSWSRGLPPCIRTRASAKVDLVDLDGIEKRWRELAFTNLWDTSLPLWLSSTEPTSSLQPVPMAELQLSPLNLFLKSQIGSKTPPIAPAALVSQCSWYSIIFLCVGKHNEGERVIMGLFNVICIRESRPKLFQIVPNRKVGILFRFSLWSGAWVG
jgi:hypothetical protein